MRTCSLSESSPDCAHKIFSHCWREDDHVRLTDVISEEFKLSQDLPAGSAQPHILVSEASHWPFAPTWVAKCGKPKSFKKPYNRKTFEQHAVTYFGHMVSGRSEFYSSRCPAARGHSPVAESQRSPTAELKLSSASMFHQFHLSASPPGPDLSRRISGIIWRGPSSFPLLHLLPPPSSNSSCCLRISFHGKRSSLSNSLGCCLWWFYIISLRLPAIGFQLWGGRTSASGAPPKTSLKTEHRAVWGNLSRQQGGFSSLMDPRSPGQGSAGTVGVKGHRGRRSDMPKAALHSLASERRVWIAPAFCRFSRWSRRLCQRSEALRATAPTFLHIPQREGLVLCPQCDLFGSSPIQRRLKGVQSSLAGTVTPCPLPWGGRASWDLLQPFWWSKSPLCWTRRRRGVGWVGAPEVTCGHWPLPPSAVCCQRCWKFTIWQVMEYRIVSLLKWIWKVSGLSSNVFFCCNFLFLLPTFLHKDLYFRPSTFLKSLEVYTYIQLYCLRCGYLWNETWRWTIF